MTRWEYKRVECDDDELEQILNDLGRKGWEVVAAWQDSEYDSGREVLLKRPID
ncbi:DUF4177 domain-containing protein [Catenulispora sp. NL8]|uniref:DUF4177 domain-containing protein n=1 Tax=Catenulispora pinistramenti TaxID=2705254 RepID=A0ABS5L8M8_9ACTN|nr:DUF4177 domain-containing protein [Catenulispora pinistramenti]MBS2554575.1 DUF4177 domain-containing protein [Catenulispora pinistramenti]